MNEMKKVDDETMEGSDETIERKIMINGQEVIFVCDGVDKIREEEGAIKVETSEIGSRIFLWRDGGIPCEIGVTNNELAIINENCSLGMQDSLDRKRVMRYVVDEELKEINIHMNGEYQIGEGKMKVEDDGRRLILSIGSTSLVVDGFNERRRIRYTEKLKDSDYDTIIDILSRKDINAARRAEALMEFCRRAAEINGDRHGLAKGVARILTSNDVRLVLHK